MLVKIDFSGCAKTIATVKDDEERSRLALMFGAVLLDNPDSLCWDYWYALCNVTKPYTGSNLSFRDSPLDKSAG